MPRRSAKTIYLDYASTTPEDPSVVDVMKAHMGPRGTFGNPASTTHLPGQVANKAVEKARESVADLVGADPNEIVWTSGATESINLAIKGVAMASRNKGKHIVTSCLEHSAVLDSCRFLSLEGFEVTHVRPDDDGLITPAQVERLIRKDTILVSLMHVNNETGAVTDVGAIGERLRDRKITFHVDAVQSVARIPVAVHRMQADFASISGHKIYGPKGIGALFVRKESKRKLFPQIHGGDQEMGLRAGTLATHQIVGMGEAAQILIGCRTREIGKIAKLEDLLLSQLTTIPDTHINGTASKVPGILNMRFRGVQNESLMLELRDEIALSSGSACTSTRVEPSHVLLGMGLSEDEASCSVRMSFGRFTSEAEVRKAGRRISEAVFQLREISRDLRN